MAGGAAIGAPRLVTARLHLRGWREADLAALGAINADPAVMAHLGGPMEREASDLMVGRFLQKWQEEPRFGWWAVERTGRAGLIGFVGLGEPDFDDPPAPCVEIGWRLARTAWGQGLASEAARACLAHAFGGVGLAEVLSFTTPDNLRSRAVMERIGMTRDPDGDFDHPLIAEQSPLRRHVLYRIAAKDWRG